MPADIYQDFIVPSVRFLAQKIAENDVQHGRLRPGMWTTYKVSDYRVRVNVEMDGTLVVERPRRPEERGSALVLMVVLWAVLRRVRPVALARRFCERCGVPARVHSSTGLCASCGCASCGEAGCEGCPEGGAS